MSQRYNSTTGVCGVSKRYDKYLANGPMIDGKRKYLGIYSTVEEARVAIEKYNNSINYNGQ
jgi:hypothetical protein